MTREEHLLAAMVEAVDTLVDDFDLIDFLHQLCDRCNQLLDVTAVGVMLADPDGRLQVIAASDEHTRLLELFALQTDQGPCVECHRSGTPRLNVDLTSPVQTAAFPRFAARARQAGFTTTHALPMRLRQQSVGAMNLFDARAQDLSATDARVAQALADVATIAILQQRTIMYGNVERAQLRAALSSRIVIEQAKGVLAERWNTDLDTAFDALRRHARAHQLPLTRMCQQVIDGALDTTAIQRP
ncbi:MULTISPECIES: GAF and ANTAR domain-containing protein [Streptomyces]|uniref:GAF and ANTAR domain-containing protein n=2 Tax=Streptomyces rimosus subsp. rimosus TaxID=132474 RepID=L8EZ26_STRR1|nr:MULTISPECIES: GAF and ANTAR domain-containing protein [Streptomyces]KOG75014.1 transcriptional regulator [Kitasatospora aureofaciens]MYT41774.1 ANTAR domain-containing protein [Streptomyces sp. SID5471]KOT41811.1 transcriptional regulator [Streptomyces sp. NRRL WC-3701]KOT43967.1 transcriptional regulator [Streptomyces rimosus subsp. rimosus]KOT67305.1 transcriptional regulator [Streptomyces rimosus subsp. rimosus]